ncbi:MAG: hypothetical protein AB8D78_13805 [Akkermansiaceae bacterium]
MIRNVVFLAISVFAFSVSLRAQGTDKPTPVQFRAVLHDPVRPVANLFYMDEDGVVVKLNFRPKALTKPLLTLPANGSLVLYDKAEIDPENPSASLAASIKIPTGVKNAIILVIPAPKDKIPAYRMLMINDSEKTFPKGESRVIPLVGVKTAVQAGEHRISVDPGKIVRVPPVRKTNEYNMAQTNFYYQRQDSWVAFTERQLQYLDANRRLFIVHATPGALAPTVSTIVDTSR